MHSNRAHSFDSTCRYYSAAYYLLVTRFVKANINVFYVPMCTIDGWTNDIFT